MNLISRFRLLNRYDLTILFVAIFSISSVIWLVYQIHLFNINCIDHKQIFFGTVKEQAWCLSKL